VAERHANFIVGSANASAADIEALIEAIRTDVRRETGIALEPEVKIVGVPVTARRVSGGT
jgi:UDP-N-acetylmuramate dehydrogenase